jgi:hypothetical protein
MTSRLTNRSTCRGTQTHGVGEVVDDEPTRGEVVNNEPRDEPRDVPRHPDAQRSEVVDDKHARAEVVDDERRDVPHDVPKQPDARRC